MIKFVYIYMYIAMQRAGITEIQNFLFYLRFINYIKIYCQFKTCKYEEIYFIVIKKKLFI